MTTTTSRHAFARLVAAVAPFAVGTIRPLDGVRLTATPTHLYALATDRYALAVARVPANTDDATPSGGETWTAVVDRAALVGAARLYKPLTGPSARVAGANDLHLRHRDEELDLTGLARLAAGMHPAPVSTALPTQDGYPATAGIVAVSDPGAVAVDPVLLARCANAHAAWARSGGVASVATYPVGTRPDGRGAPVTMVSEDGDLRTYLMPKTRPATPPSAT